MELNPSSSLPEGGPQGVKKGKKKKRKRKEEKKGMRCINHNKHNNYNSKEEGWGIMALWIR